LGRQVEVACADCGAPFTVVELRQQGGYTASKQTRCANCKRERGEKLKAERQVAEKEQQVKADDRWRQQRQIYLYQAQIDAALLQDRDPLRYDAFRLHLRGFVAYWLSQPTTRRYADQYYTDLPIGPGCMMCGDSPVYLFIANKKAIPYDSPFWDIAVEAALDFHHRIGLRYEIEWPPLETHYQVLWRMTPDSYFERMPVFPLKHMPLLLLCEGCADVFAGSHSEVPV
jgi:hypothetical protein